VESFTISGEVDLIENFVAEVKKTGVLAKVVDSAGIAFHSSHMANCDGLLKNLLREIIRIPKIRSEKWISTSENEDIEGYSTFSDAEYFKNNLLSPVRFSAGMKRLPENSLAIEIAPHSLLQGIVKQNLPECEYIGLAHRNSEDGVVHLLQSIGKIFQNGHDMDIREIYPQIEFPVSRGTRMIAPLVMWNHAESHFVPYFNPMKRFDKRELTLNLYNPKYASFTAHQIDGKKVDKLFNIE
jgi:fatty acid synthase, animal type